jgi:hypothetical protein
MAREPAIVGATFPPRAIPDRGTNKVKIVGMVLPGGVSLMPWSHPAIRFGAAPAAALP